MAKFFWIALLSVAIPLLAGTKVLIFAGSTRTDSYNKKLAAEAAKLAEKMGAQVTLIDLKDYPMPLYDADLEREAGMPENAKRFRDLMIGNDQILISSPEYNASIPAVLKNALDWASRSEEGSFSGEAFQGKKFGIMSASPGMGGGIRGLAHLRAVIENVGGKVVQGQVAVSKAYEAFNDQGALENSVLKQDLANEVKQVLLIR